MANKFCPFCGKRTNWPKRNPTTCSMKCAALAGLQTGFEESTYCEECGKERFVDCECGDDVQAVFMAEFQGISLNEAKEVVARERELRLEIDNQK